MRYEPTDDEIEAACAEQEQRYEDYWDGGSPYRVAQAEEFAALADSEPDDAIADPGPYCGACGHPARPGDPLVTVASANVPIHYSHVTDPESGFHGEQVTSPACTECGKPLKLRDHDGKDHVDCAAGSTP